MGFGATDKEGSSTDFPVYAIIEERGKSHIP